LGHEFRNIRYEDVILKELNKKMRISIKFKQKLHCEEPRQKYMKAKKAFLTVQAGFFVLFTGKPAAHRNDDLNFTFLTVPCCLRFVKMQKTRQTKVPVPNRQ